MADIEMNAQGIQTKCGQLYSVWNLRNYQFKEWYETITMVDKLKETNMESFVSNEPRTFYSLALHLLAPEELTFRIPLDKIAPEDINEVNAVEEFLASTWKRLERRSRLRGRESFLRELVSFLLITGWYSVFSVATQDEIVAEVWNPADVYPEFYDDGLLKCAHIYALTADSANCKVSARDWKVRNKFMSAVKLYDYWEVVDQRIYHGIALGNDLVVPWAEEPTLDKIPIYCSPVAGLPDRGSLMTTTTTDFYLADWRKTMGQGIVAANTNIFHYINKMMTFMMQLLRDTAQPRWIEKGTGEAKVKPEDIFKRGAVFHLGLNEDLAPLQSPAIPIELRAMLFDIAAMRQKGALPDALFGSIQQPISGYLMSQISGAASHVLRPYQQALKFMLSEMINDWLIDIRTYNLKPFGAKLPRRELPPMEVDLRLDIPGDIVQRATVARMLDPTFNLSTRTVTDMLFPEIANPLAEQARVRASRSLQHPVALAIDLINALETQAKLSEEAGDTRLAARYRNAASVVESQLGAQQGARALPGAAPLAIPEELR